MEDSKGGLKLEISDNRQKIDMHIDYNNQAFLGELIPIDFTFKCRKRCEIVQASLELIDVSNEVGNFEEQERSSMHSSNAHTRKSTSLPITDEMNLTQSDNLFELVENAPNADKAGPDFYYCKPTSEGFDTLPMDESEMEKFRDNKVVDIPEFNENQTINLRICPKFYFEGHKNFKIVLKYSIIKVFEDKEVS